MKGSTTMTEFHTGDLVKLASGITPEIGTVGATGTAHLGGRAVSIIEVLWPIGSVPETTTINGARKLHTSTELVSLTAWEQATHMINKCADCMNGVDVCETHSALLNLIADGGDLGA
jgi:hypothetical protein